MGPAKIRRVIFGRNPSLWGHERGEFRGAAGIFSSLSLKDPEADRLAREIADRTGETLTGAIVVALRERLARLRAKPRRRLLSEELREIGERCAALPTLDDRSDDEILGYDENGLPR